ncbi:MAG: L-aspartate oxidase, partial [Planctomycetota bacterium]
QIFTDTLVIGAGGAGLRAAAAATGGPAGSEVIVLAKGTLDQNNTAWAQGGIAAVMDLAEGADPSDTFDSHVQDTLTAGAGLCDEEAVRLVVEQGPAELRTLVEWGANFDRLGDALALGREGGHAFHRILHAGGDATGAEVQRVLLERIASTAGVRVFDECFALDLLTAGDEVGAPVLGAITWHKNFGLQVIWATTTILAAGGAGQVYRETTNPRVATADGIAMAYRAGAGVADMAFVQFHPTVLYLPGAARALISEAVRGEGALLLDEHERRFMPDVHALAELAPRDVVSGAIVDRIAEQGGSHVWLDCRGVAGFADRFPGITRVLAQFDLDASRDLIPVHPAAHYMVGGVRTDLEARTGVPGLLAAGEVACMGLHGANRLASNSLLETLVMGRIAGEVAAERAGRGVGNGNGPKPVRVVSAIPPSDQGELDLTDVRSSLRSAMWRNVGVRRLGARLDDAVEMLDFWAKYTMDKVFDDPAGWETQNLLLAGALVARSAAWRTESRGCHTRDDADGPSDAMRAHDVWHRGRGEPGV